VLVGWNFKGIRSTGSKVERARPLSSAAEVGNVKLVRGPWVSAFLDEAEAFPEGGHDDQIDSVSGALAELVVRRPQWRPL
jgi:predicted phage terminase large subunit-like protein